VAVVTILWCVLALLLIAVVAPLMGRSSTARQVVYVTCLAASVIALACAALGLLASIPSVQKLTGSLESSRQFLPARGRGRCPRRSPHHGIHHQVGCHAYFVDIVLAQLNG
jgi:hypothetical protein